MNGTNLFAPFDTNTDAALCDASGYAVIAKCTGAPQTTASKYQHGCIMLQTDTATGSRAIWQNIGSVATPSWSLLDTSLSPISLLAYNSDATAGPLTIAAAKMVDAILDRDGGATNRTDTTDTAANIIAAIPNATTGTAFYFYLRNISATAGQKITLAAGVGVTLSGSTEVYSGGQAFMIGRVTGAATVTLYADTVTDALLPVSETASSVNTVQMTTAATANAPIISAVGSDANIGLTLSAKGTGQIGLGTTAGAGTGAILIGNGTDSQGVSVQGPTVVHSISTGALAIGANGTTNPVLQVDASAVTVATGIKVTGAAAAGGVNITAISSGTNESLTINAKGTGIVITGDTGTASATTGAATLSTQNGIVTSESLTTAAGATYTLTLTNTKIAASSNVMVTTGLGTSTQGLPIVTKVTPGVGSATIVITNAHASLALNGTILIQFKIVA